MTEAVTDRTINGIPFIDFGDFGDGSSPAALAIGRKFFAACKDTGFAYLTNTGMPQAAIDEMFHWSRKFFALSEADKMSAPRPKEGWWHRGYSGVGKEQGSQNEYDPVKLAALRKTSPDYKESFDLGSPAPGARLPNVFPPPHVLPGFQDACLAFFGAGRALQGTVLTALALGFENAAMPPDFFAPFHTEAANQVRLLHYPPAPLSSFLSGERGRVVAHTDFGTGTLLFQDPADTRGGLEVETRADEWVRAPPIQGAVLFNIGDLLMRWSNDVLRSTTHRVTGVFAPKDGAAADEDEIVEGRFSIPYFMGPNANAVIDCIEGCYDPADPSSKKYAPITASEYIDMRMTANYA
ncbi:flavonol synthase/flavanone 3-hydroxylase [Athelia psychrophila]|uniref:Flavonol synthase/flavanone 3-hydroxylase n=3 Tax=Athelia psychrophila TaxID=1759441 RepID=A0A166CBY0_9AGAM|nr:flavonol synthase/flavanone 3-hydroxylase [Fibularhizoctonia sp. CBS 109695]